MNKFRILWFIFTVGVVIICVHALMMMNDLNYARAYAELGVACIPLYISAKCATFADSLDYESRRVE